MVGRTGHRRPKPSGYRTWACISEYNARRDYLRDRAWDHLRSSRSDYYRPRDPETTE